MLTWPGAGPLVIGVVQPRALPGSPNWHDSTIDTAIETVARDTKTLADAGIGSVIVQNLWDGPSRSPASALTVACMSVIVRAARKECPGLLGVNLDVNDGPATLATAVAGGADFIRIKVLVGTMLKSSGIITGCAAELAEVRRRPGVPPIAVLADVHDRSGTPLGGVALLDDLEGAMWSGADGLIITGRDTSSTIQMLTEARTITEQTPLIVGGGTNPDNVDQILAHADGIVAGVYLKQDGVESAPVDPQRAEKYADAVRRAAAATSLPDEP
jgi:membrane complex biogenesis BtpA family protein